MTISERRLIENEMIFRRANEKVSNDLSGLDHIYVKDDNQDLMWDDTYLIRFQCECSDENCSQRIPMKLSTYRAIHEDRSSYIVIPNHQVKAIEKVISTEETYSIVQKNKSITNPGTKLNKTPIDNM